MKKHLEDAVNKYIEVTQPKLKELIQQQWAKYPLVKKDTAEEIKMSYTIFRLVSNQGKLTVRYHSLCKVLAAFKVEIGNTPEELLRRIRQTPEEIHAHTGLHPSAVENLFNGNNISVLTWICLAIAYGYRPKFSAMPDESAEATSEQEVV